MKLYSFIAIAILLLLGYIFESNLLVIASAVFVIIYSIFNYLSVFKLCLEYKKHKPIEKKEENRFVSWINATLEFALFITAIVCLISNIEMYKVFGWTFLIATYGTFFLIGITVNILTDIPANQVWGGWNIRYKSKRRK
jgi:amino acid transporter